MPRLARLTYPGGFYHIFNRGLNKSPIFQENNDYDKLLDTLTSLLDHGDWLIYTYCLMPNHYHFLIEEKKTPVSKLISRLFTSYSLYFNKKYHRHGPLFEDRFKSRIIQKDPYFMLVSRYIHLNPYKSKQTNNPEDYPYSSLSEYTGKSFRKIINFSKVSLLLGEGENRLSDYLKFVKDGLNMNLDEYDPFTNDQEIIGKLTFSSHRKMKSYRT